MRKPSRGIIPDFILKDESRSKRLHGEYPQQTTCESIAKLERIPSILPINDKIYLSKGSKR